MDPFIITVRDGWGRPVRRLDHNALAVAILAASIGAGLFVFHRSSSAARSSPIVSRCWFL
jgi:hypothetical protein